MLTCSLILLLSFSSSFANLKKLETVYKWKYIDYVWLSEEHKKTAIENGEYIHTSVIPMDFDVASGKKTFAFL